MTLKELVEKGEAAEKAASESRSDGSGKTLLELVRDGEKNKPKNVGGLGGGLEYLGTKFVDGLVSNVEGLVDFAVGGLADLIGFDDFAKGQFEKDWYNYSRADEKFNPDTGWKIAGDISSVVGGAAPEVALGFMTGGSGNLAKAIGLGVSGASAAGRTLNEAVNTTGELGAKEWIGGIATGSVASIIELISSGLGSKTFGEIGGELAESASKKGGTKVTGSILKKTAGKALGEVAGETAEGGVKKTLQEILDSKLLGEIIKQAGSEAGEEGIESILENKIKQHTYDPEASDITLDEVLYSSLLGGIAGAGITGTTLGLASGIDSVNGAKLYKNKTRLEGILESARLISDYEKKKDTAIPAFEAIRDTYESVSKRLESGGLTMQGYAELGNLERLVDSASADKLAVATARKIFANKDAMAEIYSKYYGQSVSGDELVNGLKTDGTNRAFNRSVRSAIQTNPVLRRVLLNNMIGQLSFDAMNYANSIYDGTQISTIATQENINRFLAKADKATLAEVGAALGISDWANLTPDELARAIKAFRDSGRAELYRGGYEAAKRAASFSGDAVALPSADGRLQALSALSDGVTRYRSDGMDIAVVKEGDKYRLYDYESGKITRQMTLDEMNELLSNIEERIADFKAESEMAALDREIDKFADENIPEYKKLTSSEREAVRETIRRARANGASEADQILFGRLAAKSGLKLVLTENITGNSGSGEGRYTIKRDTNGDFFVEVDSPIFSGTESPQKILQTLSQVVENKFSDLVQVKGQKIGINKKTAREWVWSKSADTLMKTDSQAFIDKANTFENANELLQASKDYIGEKAKHRRKDKFVEFARGVVSFVADGRGYAADIIVGTTKSGAAVLYDLVNIQNKKIVADASYATQNRRSDATTTNNSIPDSSKNVKTSSKNSSRNALSGEDMRQVAKYDGKNTVYIDAKADRVDTFSALLGHEMFHKMFRSKRVKGLFMQVFNRLDADKKAEVESDYRKFLTAQGKKNIGAELDEEVAAAYAQELFNSPDVWDFILEGEPSLSDRIIAFFGGVPKRYAFADGMDAAAKRWLNHYKKLFNEVAELNKGVATIENAAVNESYDAENAVSGDLTLTNEQKMQVSEGKREKITVVGRAALARGKTADKATVKLKADLATDTVFSQSSVDRIMGESEALKELPRGMKSSLAEEIFLDMNESLNEGDRSKLRIEYTVKIKEAILGNENGKYYGAGIIEQTKLRDEIDTMMREISEAGKASRRSKMAEEVRGEVKSEESKTRRVLAKIYSSLKRIDDTKRRRYAAASDYKGKELGGAIDALTRLDWRGELNHTIARKQIKVLSDWYSESNPMFKKQTDSPFEFSYFDPGIRYRLDKLTEIENGVLKLSDLEMLADVTEYFSKLIGEYDMAYVEGKWQSGEDLVYRFGEGVKAQKGVKLPFGLRILRNKVLSGDFRTYGDSLSVMKLADCYQDGIFTTFYNEWQNGIISADGAALRIREEYDAFMKKNPAYLADAEKKSAKLHGAEVSKIELIEYLMTLKRKQAWESIAEGGIVITKQTENFFGRKRKGADVHIYPISPIAKGQGYSKRLEAAILAEQELVESKLTARDKEYIKILEAGYLAAKEVKAEGDVKRLGFASVIDGYYYPIRHAYTEHLSDFDREMVASDKYASASFNKHTEDKANSAIRIGSADSTFHRHIGGVTRYLHLSPVMDSFNKVYKLKVPDTKPATYQEWYDAMRTPGKSHSLQTLIAQSDSTWRDGKGVVGFSYLQNMMLDTMGSIKLEGDGFAGKLRSGYVGFALGANPKVLATQFSSLFASTSMISGKSHFKGAFSWRRGMDNYSTVARLRDSDYTIAKSDGVVDKVEGFSKFFTKGISLVDRFVVYRAWNACQAEVEATQGLKIGTEENLIAAGKLLDEVILNTQQNAFASRKTEGARRGNMLVKTILMFKSDAITVTGRVIDAWGEKTYLATRLKQKNMSASEKTELKKQYKASDKKLSRAVGAVAMSAVYMVAVAEAFKHLYGKADDKEEKEEKIERLRAEFIGNLIGGAPILSELHSYFTQGYDLSTMEFSAINDILATVSDVAEYAENLLDGTADDRDWARLIEKMLYTIGQGFGVPFRNIKNITYGITKMFNGELAYKWDSALYKQGYASDLNDAIEKGDVQMATTILELALGENLGSGLSDAARDELVRLSGLGEKMIPSAISDTVTIDGEERELSGKELSAVREKYAEAVERINSFIDSELYESYNDEQKASAVRKIYSLYKDLAYDSVVGTDRNPDMLILSGLIDADVLCAWVSTGVLTSDKDENGKTIAGSKREKVVRAISSLDVSIDERLLLIAMKGYALADGDIRGVSAYAAKVRLYNYIAELDGLTDEERLELYEASGFEIKNGEAEYPRASTSSSGSKKGASLSGGGLLSGKTKGILSGGGGLLSKGGGILSNAVKNRVIKVGKLN